MILTIIIPVFNAEKYLGECLESITDAVKNANKKVEILVIDNGSSDKSMDTAKKYRDVHVLKCETPGAAAVRNYGVSKAHGDFIWFIDADDTISPDAISLLLDSSNGADLVMMGAKRIYEDGHTDYLSAVDPSTPDYKSRFVRYGMGPWQVIIRRSWWNKNGFSFREGIIHEDMELMSSLILYTDAYAAVDGPLYFYRQTQNSVLHRASWSEHAYDIFPALEGLYGRFKALHEEKHYHDELEWFFIWNLLIDSAKDFADFPEGKPGFARARKMMREYFPGWKKNRFLREKPIKFRIKVRLNYYK